MFMNNRYFISDYFFIYLVKDLLRKKGYYSMKKLKGGLFKAFLILFFVAITMLGFYFIKHRFQVWYSILMVIAGLSVLFTLAGTTVDYKDKNITICMIAEALMCVLILVFSIYILIAFQPIVIWFLKFINASKEVSLSNCLTVILTILPFLISMLLKDYQRRKTELEKGCQEIRNKKDNEGYSLSDIVKSEMNVLYYLTFFPDGTIEIKGLPKDD